MSPLIHKIAVMREELRLLQEQLSELELDAAAEQVDRAIKEYSSGDAHLAAALEQARG